MRTAYLMKWRIYLITSQANLYKGVSSKRENGKSVKRTEDIITIRLSLGISYRWGKTSSLNTL